jgi:hypothetical protein
MTAPGWLVLAPSVFFREPWLLPRLPGGSPGILLERQELGTIAQASGRCGAHG